MSSHAEGFRHAHGCPHGEIEEGLAGEKRQQGDLDDFDWDSEQEDGNEVRGKSHRSARRLCRDRRCCTWFDLSNWFGFLPLELQLSDFEACFTDVASGGIGLYEKLIVLGGKTLSLMAEMHFYELFSNAKGDVYIPASLTGVDQESLRLIWAGVRAERVCGPQGLFLFGRSYLATAQTLSTRQAVAKYVKACIGYGCQNNETENIYRWMPVLVEHIFWTQKLRTERRPEDNNLLQDLQDFLGYKYDHLLPRIRECLENPTVPQRSDVPTGRELLKLYATDYFTSMAEMSSVPPRERALWVEEEVSHFLASPAIAVFASMAMSLGPFLSHSESEGPPSASDFVSTFESLVAACWIISTEEKVKMWMPALIQRLRQIQLTLQMGQLGDNKYFSRGEALRRPASVPVDVRNMARANAGFVDRFRLWNVDPTRRPLAEHPVVYAPPPVPAGPAPRLQMSCEVPCCLSRPFSAQQQNPPQTPGAKLPRNKVLYLVDSVDRRFELYPLGPQPLPLPTRRRQESSAFKIKTPATKDAACSTQELVEAPQSNAPSRGVEGPSQHATVASRHPAPIPFLPHPRLVGVRPPVQIGPPAEPKLRIRYMTSDDAASANEVEVLVDDVAVHRQTLSCNSESSDADFKAVLSVPNSSRPVVLNFVRSGEDGKPTLYITDDRPRGAELKTQRRLESPGAAKTEARCLSVRNCGGGEDGCSESDVSGLSVLGEGANQGEGGVCSSFGCPTSTRGVAPATARLGAVDIQMRPVLLNSVSPAPPVYSLPVSDSESVGCGWQGIACCAAPARRPPTPVASATGGVAVVPRIRAFTKRTNSQGT